MATLTLDEGQAKKFYPTATPEFKAMLEHSFGKKVFCVNVMERVKSFEDACAENGTDPNDIKFTQGTVSGIHMERIAEIAKALNGGRVMKGGEKRYYPYFEYAPSGFRFGGSGYGISGTGSDGGPRLCVLNPELAKYLGTQFITEFDKYLNPPE